MTDNIQNDKIKYRTGEEFKEGGYKFSIITIQVDDVYLTRVSCKPDLPVIKRPYFELVEINHKEYQVDDFDQDTIINYQGDYFINEVYPKIKKDMTEYIENGELTNFTED